MFGVDYLTIFVGSTKKTYFKTVAKNLTYKTMSNFIFCKNSFIEKATAESDIHLSATVA